MLQPAGWPRLARLVREQCLPCASILCCPPGAGPVGASPAVYGHLLPNTIPILVVMATMAVANAILESALSYLGLGVLPPTFVVGAIMMDAA